jgi:DnaJ like chaperone protein
MSLFTSLFGAGIGWWLGGPLGAVLGFIFGHITDSGNQQSRSGDSRQQRDGFVASLLVLIAAVMKADGRVVKSELDFVKRSLLQSLGEEKASQAILALRDIIKQDIPINEVTHQIRINLDYSSRLELLHLLFNVGLADGSLTNDEIQVIIQIAVGMGISNADIDSIRNMFVDNTDAAYKVLEIDPSATDDEIKKAYRKMALRYHPDKVIHLGPEFQKSATEKFQKVNEAYEKLKSQRGFK